MRGWFDRKHHKVKKNNKGTTLVELVVSMALTAILASAVVGVMYPVVSIFVKMQKLSRAQIVADTITDTLRKECSSTYITSYADARVVNLPESADYTSGDDKLLTMLAGQTSVSQTSGNTLIIRKNEGYAEALYWNTWISADDYNDVLASDKAPETSNVTSRAVYRLFPEGTAITSADMMPAETAQGYLHCGYYETSVTTLDIDGKTVEVMYPYKVYDYTNPFSVSVYGNFTTSVTYSGFTYDSVVDGSDSLADKRPAYVVATVKIYDGNYSEQSAATLLYTREAVLCFAQDNEE